MTPSGDARRAVEVVGLLVLVAAVAPFVVYAVPQVIGAEQSYVVVSGSMTPTIHPGDVVVVDGGPAAVQTGDVITFTTETDQRPVTHRVVDVRRVDGVTRFVTRGDANEDPDPGTVRPEQVVGEVRYVVPFVGRIILFGNRPYGALVLVGVPVALLVLSEAYVQATSSDETTGGASDERTTGGATTGEATADDDPGSGVAGATAADGAGLATSAREDDGSTDTITVTRTDLRGVLAVLALGTLYTGAVAYALRSAWAVAAFVATGSTLAVVGGVAHAAPEAEEAPRGDRVLSDGAISTTDAGPPCDPSRDRVTVASSADFLELAAGCGRAVHDCDGSYVLSLSDTAIVFDEEPAEPADAPGEDASDAGPADASDAEANGAPDGDLRDADPSGGASEATDGSESGFIFGEERTAPTDAAGRGASEARPFRTNASNGAPEATDGGGET